jgi:hypothetical protein
MVANVKKRLDYDDKLVGHRIMVTRVGQNMDHGDKNRKESASGK